MTDLERIIAIGQRHDLTGTPEVIALYKLNYTSVGWWIFLRGQKYGFIPWLIPFVRRKDSAEGAELMTRMYFARAAAAASRKREKRHLSSTPQIEGE